MPSISWSRIASVWLSVPLSQPPGAVAGLRFDEADIRQVLGAMRGSPVGPAAPQLPDLDAARADLQRLLAAGEVSIDTFSRGWRRLDREVQPPAVAGPPDELRLRRARDILGSFGTLWRDPDVPDRLREEALHEILARVDVEADRVVAIYPQENENAWLLGQAALRKDRQVGMVGARGDKPSLGTLMSRPRCRSKSR